ncbi:GNAT family N-acetyltransferase [Oceanobacillus sp. FSL W8-0428]|uniref:GNAT family N-acetyltransferase n=1 Tax=Oceanobacillus TaxID=182709 RepID=UPI000B217C59
MEHKIDICLEKDNKFTDFLHQKIKDYNNKHSPHHRRIREKEAIHPINIIVSDNDNNWIGGLSAEVYWGWLEVDYFWICEKHRGKGLGRRILIEAEMVGKEKGATKALLTTFEFQARSFYEMNGYQVAGEIEGYPPGSSYCMMVKSLL